MTSRAGSSAWPPPPAPWQGPLERAPRVVAGRGAVDRLPDLVAALGFEPADALIVTDAGVRAAGLADRAGAHLAAGGWSVTVDDTTREDPTFTAVEDQAARWRSAPPALVVAVGGGSSIDAAKGIALLLGAAGPLRRHLGWHTDAAARPLPLVAAPTTTGSGSECQSYALFVDDAAGAKRAVGHPGLMPRLAVLDPTLVASQPRSVAVHASVDALTHACEVLVSTRTSPAAQRFAEAALGHLFSCLDGVLGGTPTPVEQAAAQLGAACAGSAIEHGMLGAAHATGNPLTTDHGVPHGAAVGAMLPAVIALNATVPAARARYAAAARTLGVASSAADDGAACGAFEERIRRLIGRSGVRASLPPVAEIDLGALVAAALDQWTGSFNPRALDAPTCEALYRSSLGSTTKL